LRPVDLKDISTDPHTAKSLGTARTVVVQPRGKAVNVDSLKLSRQKMDKLCFNFIGKLHQLIGSGLPLGDAMKSLTARISDPTLHAVCERIWQQLSEGATLAGAMRAMPNIFEPTISSMIEAGEATG